MSNETFLTALQCILEYIPMEHLSRLVDLRVMKEQVLLD